jgi:hypothetical protein
MKVWIKLVKHFQGGSHTDYMLVDPKEIDSENKKEDLMETWGENSDGGQNYGYRVDMFTLNENEFPPKEWIEKEIERTEDEIEYAKKNIDNKNKFLIELQLLKIKLI